MASSNIASWRSLKVGGNCESLLESRKWIYRLVCTEGIDKVYILEQEIGRGGFGTVYLAQHVQLGYHRAVKKILIDNGEQDRQEMMNEINTLMDLDHPHILKLLRMYDDGTHLYIVSELCAGPSLLNRILDQENKMTMLDTGIALRHILKGVRCCHSHYMGHYDIKPDNFMYSDAECRSLKMIDLGMSSGFKRQSDEFKGTVAYTAPEVWSGVFGPEADIWSSGVIFYSMVTRKALCPMMAADEKIKAWVQDCAWIAGKMDVAERSGGASAEGMDLLRKMLCTDRHLRMTAAEALRHPYINMTYKNDDRPLEQKGAAIEIIRSVVPRFIAFGEEPVFRRAVLLVMVHIAGYTAKHTQSHRLAYKLLDETGTGDVSVETIEASMTRNGISIGEELDDAFKGVDLNKDGYINFGEFLAATLPDVLRCSESVCRRVFSLLDRNRDGFIDQDDVAATFLAGTERHDSAHLHLCREMLTEVCSQDAQLDFDEFFLMILAGSTPISTGCVEKKAQALRMTRSGHDLSSLGGSGQSLSSMDGTSTSEL